MEKKRTLVGRPDFKSGERRQTSLVGSTPTLFRHLATCFDRIAEATGTPLDTEAEFPMIERCDQLGINRLAEAKRLHAEG